MKKICFLLLLPIYLFCQDSTYTYKGLAMYGDSYPTTNYSIQKMNAFLVCVDTLLDYYSAITKGVYYFIPTSDMGSGKWNMPLLPERSDKSLLWVKQPYGEFFFYIFDIEFTYTKNNAIKFDIENIYSKDQKELTITTLYHSVSEIIYIKPISVKKRYIRRGLKGYEENIKQKTQYFDAIADSFKLFFEQERGKSESQKKESWENRNLIYSPFDNTAFLSPVIIKYGNNECELLYYNNESELRYYVLLSNGAGGFNKYRWNYFAPKENASQFSNWKQLETITSAKLLFKDYKHTILDDPNFWSQYVLLQEDGKYKYLTKVD